MKAEHLAHSARNGAQEQTYRDHVANVCRYAGKLARDATAFSPKWQSAFTAIVDVAAAYHDLGKLDVIFQDILEHNRPNRHGFNHVEAGTAHLLKLKQGEAGLACARSLLGKWRGGELPQSFRPSPGPDDRSGRHQRHSSSHPVSGRR